MTTTASSTVTSPRRPWRLGGRARKLVLLLHIVAGGAWIGMDVVLGVLVFTAMFTGDVQVEALCYQALELFAVWPLVIAGLLSLATGVLLGLGSKYGLVKYWWVATKLVLNVVLVSLVLLALRTGVDEAGEIGRRLAAGEPASVSPTDLIFPPIVSTSALIFATVLSIFKPWGRIRRTARDKSTVDRRPANTT